MKKLSFVFTIFLLIFLTACEMEVEDIKRTCTLQSIKVDASNAKKDYFESDSFTSENVIIYGYYSDNTIQIIDHRYADFDGFPKSKEEINYKEKMPITVSYGGFSDSYNIQFQNDCVVDLEVVAIKEYYGPDDDLDKKTDIKVIAVYKSGDKYLLDHDMFIVEGFNNKNVAEAGTELKITYLYDKKITGSVTIHVFADSISSLVITKQPNKTKYTHKESLNFDGLEVHAYFTKISPRIIKDYKYVIYSSDDTDFENPLFSDIKLLESGKYKVFITVDDKKTEMPFEIEILEAWQEGMALDLESLPKLIYHVNEEFDITQYKFRKVLSNDSLGEEIEPSIITIDKEPDLSIPNKKITVNVSSPFYNIESEQQETAECSFDIFVTDAKLMNIVASWQSKTDYLPLGTNPSDATYGTWTVKAIYSDNREDIIPNEYCKFEFADEKIRNGEYDDFYSQLAASTASSVNYSVNVTFYKEKGEKYSYPCDVPIGKPKIIKAELTQYPRVRYTVGQTFDPDGLKLQVTTSDSKTEFYTYDRNDEVTLKFFNIDSYEFTSQGTEEVKIIFKKDGFEYEISIYVIVFENKPIALEISPIAFNNIYLRKGESYTNDDYKKFFKIQKVYENQHSVELKDEEYEKTIIYFEQTDIKREDDPMNPMDYGSIYAIFNDGQNTIVGKYECLEKADNLSYNRAIFIIPPLPQSITMDNGTKLDTNEFAASLTNLTTKYNIVYKDGTTYTITGDQFDGKSVKYNSIEYTLDKTFNMVRIKIKPIQRSTFEDRDIDISKEYNVADYNSLQNLDKIKSLRIEKKDKRNYKFIKSKIGTANDSYIMQNYFSAFITSFTGVEKEVTNDYEYRTYLKYTPNNNGNGFNVEYQDGASKAETEIKDNIKILDPITINDLESLLNSRNLYTEAYFSIKDEEGNTHNCKIIHSDELPEKTNFATNEPIKVQLNMKNENQKYYLTILGSIPDIDGNVQNYEIELFEDFVTGLVCENNNNNIVQMYLAEDGDIKQILSESPIKIQKFFETTLESISPETDGEFSFSCADDPNLQKITYKDENEILSLLDNPKAVTVSWQHNNGTPYIVPVILFPARPSEGEKCRKENNRKAIEFTYDHDFKKYEFFYNLFNNETVEFLDSNNGYLQKNNYATNAETIFNSVSKIKITKNGIEYQIPISTN